MGELSPPAELPDSTAAGCIETTPAPAPMLGFDEPVPAGGYRWWYVDAISDDGAHALTLIAFIGSVFSPYYAWARGRGEAPAEDHCSINLALYHAPARWCMTERDRHSLRTTPDALHVGPSSLQVRHTAQSRQLIVEVAEISTPLPRRLRGRLSVELPTEAFAPVWLDARQQHVWQPIAPRTRIAVEMTEPALSWQGNAYVDGNRGSVALETSFRSWEWSRCHPANGSTIIQYDVLEKDGRRKEKTFVFQAADTARSTPPASTAGDAVNQFAPEPVTSDRPHNEAQDGSHAETQQGNASGTAAIAPHLQTLRATRWFRIPRSTRTEADAVITDLHTLEDAPFYSRSRFRTTVMGQSCDCLHESLLLDRFDHPITRCLLPFRMPRRRSRPANPGGSTSRVDVAAPNEPTTRIQEP